VGSNLIQYTRWKWDKSHARIDFRHPILIQNDNKKRKRKVAKWGTPTKKYLKKTIFFPSFPQDMLTNKVVVFFMMKLLINSSYICATSFHQKAQFQF
jgi:hypothetical protein